MERKEKGNHLLRYTFTKEETEEISKQMAIALLSKSEAEDRLKSVSTQIKSTITEAEAKARACAEKVRSGYEYRDIECIRIYDYDANTVRFIKEETGEVLEQRSMSPSERQLPIGVS